MRRATVLLVEGDGTWRAGAASRLVADGLDVLDAATAAKGLSTARRGARIDLVAAALDRDDPHGDALRRLLRYCGVGAQIVLMVDADQVEATRTAWDEAIDIADILPRPVAFDQLRACVGRQLSRAERCAAAVLKIGPYRFYPADRRLIGDDGQAFTLTQKEARLLIRLSRADGAAVGRLELLRDVWGYTHAVATHTLETHVYRLRKKIAAEGGRAPLLVTAPEGYRLAHPAEIDVA